MSTPAPLASKFLPQRVDLHKYLADQEVLCRQGEKQAVSCADEGDRLSTLLASGIAEAIENSIGAALKKRPKALSPQTVGIRFENGVCGYLRSTFLSQPLGPGDLDS